METGCLKIIVLKALAEENLSGYNLLKKIEAIIGRKPSTGTIYTLLKSLETKNLIKAQQEKRSTLYTLTTEGKQTFLHLAQERERIFSKMQENLRFLETLEDTEHQPILSIFERIKKGQAPFSFFTPEAIALRDLMVKLADKDLSQKQKKATISLLQTTTKELKKICNQ